MIGSAVLAVLIFLLAVAAVFYAVRIETGAMELRTIRIRTRKIRGRARFLLISDMHLHAGSPSWVVAAAKNAIRSCIKSRKPDAILIAGDMIDHHSGIKMLPVFLDELSSRLGTYAVLGNHDYYQYNLLHVFSPLFDWIDRKRTDLALLEKTYRRSKVRLLRDRSVRLPVPGGGSVMLTGLDYRKDRLKGPGVLPAAPGRKNTYRILLSHYPDVVKYQAGRYDLILSGHTHGGQVTFFGWPLVSRSGIRKKHIRGTSVHGFTRGTAGDETVLHVTKGMGVGRHTPFRFFARPDITVIELEGCHDR